MTKILLAVSGNAVLTNAAIVAVLVAVLVGFSDPASAEDEVCSKLFKSDYLREVCSELRPKTDRRSDLERYVRKSCGILKIGHENPSPSFPRSSKVIADAERAVQECINQYPDLGPIQPAPTPSATLAQSLPKPRFELGGAEEAAARAACEKSADELEAKGKFDGSGVDRRVMRNAVVASCVGMERFGITLQPTPPTPTPTAYTRGLAALNEGNFDAAIAEFTAAIADDPKDTFSFIRRGTAYEASGTSLPHQPRLGRMALPNGGAAALEDSRQQHRDPSPVAPVFIAEDCDQIALLQGNTDEDIGCGNGREQQMIYLAVEGSPLGSDSQENAAPCD